MSFVRDVAGLSGVALLLFGVHQVYPPLTYVLGGMLLVGGSCLWSMKASKR